MLITNVSRHFRLFDGQTSYSQCDALATFEYLLVGQGRQGVEGGFVHCRENEDLRKSPGIGPNCPSMMAIMEVKFYWLKHRPRSSKYTSLVETPDLPSDFPGYEILGLSDGAKSVLWSYRHHTH
jgi:hypothetical protein